jgi:hypothetical protein
MELSAGLSRFRSCGVKLRGERYETESRHRETARSILCRFKRLLRTSVRFSTRYGSLTRTEAAFIFMLPTTAAAGK